MKTEINLDNKAKLFALYWGCEVMRYNDSDGDEYWEKQIFPIDSHNIRCSLDLMHLRLHPIASITDEDHLEVMFARFDSQPLSSFKKGKYYLPHLNAKQLDYLRSKGYALPWLDLSVVDLVICGWIQIIVKKHESKQAQANKLGF
jgi:hypothetical protein